MTVACLRPAQGADAGLPRLLLFSFHFPPGQSVGGLRWQMLARHAEERGLALDVLTVHPESLPSPDPSRLAQLPASTRVYGATVPVLGVERLEHAAWSMLKRLRSRPAPAAAPASNGSAPSAPSTPRPGSFGRAEIRWRVSRPRDWYRAYSAVVEGFRDLAWARAAGTIAEGLVGSAGYRGVISCGPPHMVHEAARDFAARHRLPYVMDQRDPWRLQQRLPDGVASPAWFWLANRYETKAVHQAALVVTNTEPAGDQLRELYPRERERIICVMNGYDDDPMPRSVHGDRFVLAYAGAIYLDRDPRPLFQAAARVVRDLGVTPAQFGIEMIGNVENYGGVPVSRIAEEEGIAAFVTTGPSRPRAAAMDFLARATMLVSLPQDSDLAIPSKVFEYLRFEAWSLVLAERASATGRALEGTSVDLVPPMDVDGMAAVLRRRLTAFLAGERPGAPTGIERLSRRVQADRLFTALERALGASAHR